MTSGQRAGIVLVAATTTFSCAVTGAAAWVAWQLHAAKRRNGTTMTLDAPFSN